MNSFRLFSTPVFEIMKCEVSSWAHGIEGEATAETSASSSCP